MSQLYFFTIALSDYNSKHNQMYLQNKFFIYIFVVEKGGNHGHVEGRGDWGPGSHICTGLRRTQQFLLGGIQ